MRGNAAIRLSEHFTVPRLLRFTFPTAIMLVLTMVYGVADGLFVSNLVGKTSFAAVNFFWLGLFLPRSTMEWFPPSSPSCVPSCSAVLW